MKLIHRFRMWRTFRRHQKHIRWLRRMKVVLNKPHHTCTRNGPECV